MDTMYAQCILSAFFFLCNSCCSFVVQCVVLLERGARAYNHFHASTPKLAFPFFAVSGVRETHTRVGTHTCTPGHTHSTMLIGIAMQGVYTETKFCLYVCRLGSVSNLLPVNSILRTPIDGQKSLAQFAVPAECPSLLAFLDNQTIVGECLLLD